MKKWKPWAIGTAGLGALFLSIWLMSAVYIKHKINEALAAHPTYTGKVESLWLLPFPVELRLYDVQVYRRESPEKLKFQVGEGRIRLKWASLWSEGWVIDSKIFGLDLSASYPGFLPEAEAEKEDGPVDLDKDFPRIRISRLTLENARVELAYSSGETHESIQFPSLYISLYDLATWPRGKMARFDLWAEVSPSGFLQSRLEFNPHQSPPEFDLKFTSKNISLKSFNSFVADQLNFDFEEGKLNLYAELKSVDGSYSGYIKPLLQDVKILSKEDFRDKGLGALADVAADFMKNVFENEDQEQIATRVPIEGTWEDPELQFGKAFTTLIENELVKALADGFADSPSQPKL